MRDAHTSRGLRVFRPLRVGMGALLFLAAAPLAQAADQVGAQFTLRGAHLSAGGGAAAVGALHQSGVSLGQGEALGFAGTGGDLTTSAPGFWPLVAGAFPGLDFDGDQVPDYLDPDDDNDGLPDGVETGTGVFVSAGDTGTDPRNPDSDGDAVSDGVEVMQGTDPNNPAQAVPALPPASLWMLALALVAAAGWRIRRSRRS